MVLPFQNATASSDLEWVRESFPEVIGQRLQSPALYVVSRDERVTAMDRFGFPASVQPSRASAFRLAEQMDADFVLQGRYALDGQLVRVTAQLLDVRGRKLLPELHESGTLAQLVSVENVLAWDVMRQMRPDFAESRDTYVAASNPIRVDALEHYMRGVTALGAADRVAQLQAALKLSPSYLPAIMQLAKAYFTAKNYEDAIRWFGQVPIDTDQAREANFLLGLAACSLGQYERAESAFNFLAARFPLAEVYNNLGVVALKRGRKNAADLFQKAVQGDPADADYHFNLGLTLYRAGDTQSAAKQWRDTLTARPNDAEAKALLDGINAPATAKPADPAAAATAAAIAPATPATAPKLPSERLKNHYDESSYRQLALQIQIMNEQRLASSNPAIHASFHVERGEQLMAQGFTSEAEHEFREALLLEPSSAAAHAGLGRAREVAGDWLTARSEANAALQAKESVATLLLLARVDLHDNHPESATTSVNRALALEPNNATALALQKQIAAKFR